MSGGDWMLLVEDSEDDRELALRALERGRLFNRVEVARDGVEALDCLHARGTWADRADGDLPGVVLLDLKLPLVGGIEVLERIKSCDRLREVPVVVLTSSAEQADLARCYALGVNSYIVKPVDIDQFFRAVLDLGRYWMVLNRLPGEEAQGDIATHTDR